MTSISVGAWAASGGSRPAAAKSHVTVAQPQVGSAVAPAGAPSADVRPESAAAPSGLLKPGRSLRSGKYVKSPNAKYGLLQQSDGNLVLYRGKTPLWSTQTERHPGFCGPAGSST